MAVDTAQKRFSMMGFGDPTNQLIVPTGAITDGDRSTLMDLYSGIALGPPPLGDPSSVRFTLGTAAPDHTNNGRPFTAAGDLAVDNTNPIDHINNGLPFTALGRLAVILDDIVDHFGANATPFNASSFFVFGTGAIDHFSNGLPYDSAGRVAGVSV